MLCNWTDFLISQHACSRAHRESLCSRTLWPAAVDSFKLTFSDMLLAVLHLLYDCFGESAAVSVHYKQTVEFSLTRICC